MACSTLPAKAMDTIAIRPCDITHTVMLKEDMQHQLMIRTGCLACLPYAGDLPCVATSRQHGKPISGQCISASADMDDA